MKKNFKKSETRFGCYDPEDIAVYPNEFTIQQVLEAPIRLKDKFWFVRNNCELNNDQYRKMAISVASIVLPIYESKCPGSAAPREAIKAAQDYLNGDIRVEQLWGKRRAAYAAADAYAASAAYTAASAAYAAAASAASAAYAAADADAAASTAAIAASAAATAADAYADYSSQLLSFLKTFIDTEE